MWPWTHTSRAGCVSSVRRAATTCVPRSTSWPRPLTTAPWPDTSCTLLILLSSKLATHSKLELVKETSDSASYTVLMLNAACSESHADSYTFTVQIYIQHSKQNKRIHLLQCFNHACRLQKHISEMCQMQLGSHISDYKVFDTYIKNSIEHT